MFNAPLLLETALLMLASFIFGAVIGTAARWLANRSRPTVNASAVAPQAVSTGPQLVVAPEIAPVAGRVSVAERIAAAAEGRSAAQPATGLSTAVAMPKSSLPEQLVVAPLQPASVAGETVTGRRIDNPAEAPVPVDETVAVVDEVPAAAAADTAPAATALEPVLMAVPADHVTTPEAVPDVPDDQSDDVIVHIEPTAEPETLILVDRPEQVAAEMQETHPVAAGTPAPEVTAEAPLVEPEFARDAAEADETLLDRVEVEDESDRNLAEEALPDATVPEPGPPMPVAPAPAPPTPEAEPELSEAEAELAAMRAIETGWTPRPRTAPRTAAELPEGVSSSDVVAAETAIANSGAAVASAAARAAAILEEIGPPPVPANDTVAPPEASDTIVEAATLEPAGESDAAAAVEGRSPAARGPRGFGRPMALEAPRNGSRDPLGQIKGVSPTIESALNGLGIYHFDQIAEWDQKAVVWVENHFGFKGRIGRERWIEQARDASRGRPTVARPLRR